MPHVIVVHRRPLLLGRRWLHHIFTAALLFLLHDDELWVVGDLRQLIHINWVVLLPLHGVEDGRQELHIRLVVEGVGGEYDDLVHLVVRGVVVRFIRVVVVRGLGVRVLVWTEDPWIAPLLVGVVDGGWESEDGVGDVIRGGRRRGG